MRKWSWILGAFSMLSFAGCEDATPPQQPIVKMEAPKIETPKPEPPKVEPPKVEPPKQEAVAVESVDQTGDEEMKPSEATAAARDALQKGQLDRALKMARIGTLKAPNRSSAWNTLGRVQLARGERKQARASFEKAVSLNPKSVWAQNNLGLALIYQGEYADAVDALEKATSLEPVEPYMWNNLGMAYEHLDRLDDARDAYHKAAQLKSERATENLARLEGVKSVFQTAKADPMPLDLPVTTDGGN